MLYTYRKTQKKKGWVRRREDFRKVFRIITPSQGSLLLWRRIKPISQKRLPPKSAPEELLADASQPLKNTVWRQLQLSPKQALSFSAIPISRGEKMGNGILQKPWQIYSNTVKQQHFLCMFGRCSIDTTILSTCQGFSSAFSLLPVSADANIEQQLPQVLMAYVLAALICTDMAAQFKSPCRGMAAMSPWVVLGTVFQH